ncbi:MAG: hypothetical protein A2Y59_03905 [Chloroflexi bacterium RBG_13_52_14]|nr:MAG: hypothetical protein A2Y59_03905 [Chloroflexi bacterium RBG_13_52_14]
MAAIDPELIKRIKASEENYLACIAGRGGIIDLTTMVENTLIDIIAWCFYPTAFDFHQGNINEQLDEDGIILKSLLLAKLEFHERTEIIQKIIRIKKAEVWENYRKLIKEIVKELDEVRKFRNMLAHSPIDWNKYTDALQEEGVRDLDSFFILEYRDGKVRKHTINKNKIEVEVNRIHRVWYKLLQLWALLRNDTDDAKACEFLSNLSEEDNERLLKHYGFK